MAQGQQTVDFDVAVIGGGSGGYAAARTVAAAGLRAVAVEGGAEVGGLCILRGCMPTKALLYAAEVMHLSQHAATWGVRNEKTGFDFAQVMARKDAMIGEFAADRVRALQNGRFEFIRATAKFVDPHTVALSDGRRISARHFIVSTGSVVAPPPLPQLKQVGYLTSDDALGLKQLPTSLIVLGGGAVGVEFAQFFARFGVRVTLVQRSAHLLKEMDEDAAAVIETVFRREGIDLYLGTTLVDAWRERNTKAVVFLHGEKKVDVKADEILFALGRGPNTKGLGLDKAGVKTDRGLIVTDATMRTSAPHIFAAGDCTGPHEIVHVAVMQGEIAGHNIAQPARPRRMDYRVLLNVVFTDPQVATVGLTEKEAKARGVRYLTASYPFNDHGKSLLMDAKDGFVKLLAAPDSGEILGGCCVGPMGGELIHEIAAAMHKRMTVAELAAMPHYHPTLAEIWTYPAEDLAGRVGSKAEMIARVTLEIALRREFDYLVPEEFARQVEVGTRVKVPFGPRQVLGVVTSLVEESPHTNLRPILKVVGTQSLVTARVLALARWIAGYYCCPVEVALKSVLPEAVRKEESGWRERLFVRALPPSREVTKLTKRQQEIWSLVEEWREIQLTELLEMTGATAETVRRLEDKGLVSIAPAVSERDPYAHEQILPTQPLALNGDQAAALRRILAAMNGTRAPGANPGPEETAEAVPPPGTGPTVFLLHGVTGSGKTEVYLQAIAHALEQGKGAIVLVPEISLTPQTVERFKARFSSGPLQTLVAVLHSHLSAGERHDEWHKIRQGRARIVIGARSAIFAPVEPLGLIVVDEEHEPSYKQEEAPRYHARDVAVVRGQREGAVVVLGSATPSLESYYNVRRGKYALVELPQRADDKKMPVVRVVDMRKENRKRKGAQIFSEQLKEAITQRLERGEQSILFLNRRGYSTSLQCSQCGYVAECPNCSVSLTYHRQAQRLRCHICAHDADVPRVCPQASCGNPAIRYSGLGTERVEDTLTKLFPRARIKRMDSDALKRKDDYRRILGDFRLGRIDVLVGTQMIAKGLHFPNVTLVGIVYADLGLHLPDFRASERTFQLLTQVAGRAGRGDVEGEVIVQAFTPFHPSIQYARRHDYAGFYEQEIEFREQLRYPPVSRIALLTLRGRNEEKVKFSAEHLRREVEKMTGMAVREDGKTGREENGKTGRREDGGSGASGAMATRAPDSAPAPFRDLIIAGPAPAPLARAETYYRYQIMLRTRQMAKLSERLAKLVETLTLPDDISWTVDIDPVDLA